jgi:hypothetical protein
MAGQRPSISLAELSKRVSEAVIDNIANFVDVVKIARAILGAIDDDIDMSDDNIESNGEIVEAAVCNTVNKNAIMEAVTNSLKDAGFTNEPPTLSNHPTQTVAGQRPQISLAALSEQVSEVVRYNIPRFVHKLQVADAVLDTIYDDSSRFDVCLKTKNTGNAAREAICDTCNDERITEVVTKALKDAGFTSEPPAAEASNVDEKKIEQPVAATIKATMADPRPGPSISMDVTALREQILGLFPRLPSSRTVNQLTDRTANARVIHRVYAHVFPQANFADPEVIVLNYGENFLAAIVRARLFTDVNAKSDLIVTLQVMNCKNTLEVLEKLYEESRALLYRAYESASVGKLGSWQVLIFP